MTDVSQSLHVDKMKELSKELITECGVRLEKLVLSAQVWNLPPYKTIRSEAGEMFTNGTMNWGAHCNALHICVLICEKYTRKLITFVRLYSIHQNGCCY